MKVIEVIDATSGMPVYSESGMFMGQQLNATQMTLASNLSESLAYISAHNAPPPTPPPTLATTSTTSTTSTSLSAASTPTPSPSSSSSSSPPPPPSQQAAPPPKPEAPPRLRANCAVLSSGSHNAFAISNEGETPEELRAQLAMILDLARMRGGPSFGPQTKSLRAIERLIVTAQHLCATQQSALLMCLEHLDVAPRFRLNSQKALKAAVCDSHANLEARFAMVCADSRVVALWSQSAQSGIPPQEQFMLCVHAHSLFEYSKIPQKHHGRDPFASMSSPPPPPPTPQTLSQSLGQVSASTAAAAPAVVPAQPAAPPTSLSQSVTPVFESPVCQTNVIPRPSTPPTPVSDISQSAPSTPLWASDIPSRLPATATSPTIDSTEKHDVPSNSVPVPSESVSGANVSGDSIPTIKEVVASTETTAPSTETTAPSTETTAPPTETTSSTTISSNTNQPKDGAEEANSGAEDGEESMVVVVEDEGGATSSISPSGPESDAPGRPDTPLLSTSPPPGDTSPGTTPPIAPPTPSPDIPKAVDTSKQRLSSPGLLTSSASTQALRPVASATSRSLSNIAQSPGVLLPSTSAPITPMRSSGTPLKPHSSLRSSPLRTTVRGEYTLLYLTPHGYTHTLSSSSGAVDPALHIKPHWVYTVQIFPSFYLIVVMRGQNKQPDQIKDMVARLRRSLTDFADPDFFLATHRPVLPYISSFPGLVHFMFAERVRGVCVTPPISSLYGRQYKHDAAADEQFTQHMRHVLWSHVYRTRRFLTAGYPCAILRTNQYHYSYRLWLDDDGIEVPWDTPWVLVMQKRWIDSKNAAAAAAAAAAASGAASGGGGGARGSGGGGPGGASGGAEEQMFIAEGPRPVTPEWYVELIETITAHYGRRPQRCYELYSVYIPCLPASVVARNDRALAASLIAHISN
ncbi:Hermansky-Pudlak syndrome 1 protein [Pelomyxa schiedti]|nr:Hermansky-Pudlak syndrome 1 protein [Pelomyxa schiedti]